MPRGARILVENVCYHIIARGNQKQKVFLTDEDYSKYLGLISRYKVKFKFKLYGFCLMPNHVHLIIEPPIPGEMAKAIGGINLSYAQWFNNKYAKAGHLWQDRFKSFIIEKNEYLLNCINYIEFNPIRAGITKDPLGYKWSGYKSRLTICKGSLVDKLEWD